MGLLIHTSFETPEGFPVTGVYCRIVEVTFRPQSGGQFAVSYRIECHVDRPARLKGRSPVQVPNLGTGQTYLGAFGDMTYLYGLLKTNLEEAGFTVENVDPDPQEPAPTEPAPAEPTPAEPAPTEPPSDQPL